MEKKRILILTADAGFGHRSAANAIAAALELDHGEECEVQILNPVEDRRAPFYLRDSASDYDRMVRSAPELYKLGYDASDKEIPSLLGESVMTLALFEIIRDMIRNEDPDAIVSTYPLYQAPLTAYFKLMGYYVPLSMVVTDLGTVHRIWFSQGVDMCMVPTPEVQTLAMNNGIAQNKIHVTGIPVSPAFSQKKHRKIDLRRKLGWEPTLPTILAVGSRRVDQLMETLNVLNHFGRPLQIVAVAGKDEELYSQLKSADWHVPTHIYDFVTDMPDLMMASDAVICKAGGLVVTESLAAGLPMLLVDVIPGQEEGNRDYVVQNGAGDMVETPMQMLETFSHWTANGGALMRERARNARHLGRPNSALDVAELVWRSALRGPVNKRGRLGMGRSRLIDLLTKNNIPWRETRVAIAPETFEQFDE
ncbi:UDP-N-acetylglucosamine:LPS N-acetylglucosamine transferase [Longilinea arvoryzae]|uniref:UDP-N-acetylglucosamine:LPS N-acetylglucosamine transferase n=1 Tax=Longilinea arvoryzae TaxID=360412 RepID=A0A0S7BG56_9CHLR|nr:glycosyltransferase [Longilinea arvoryzae]GAP14004.1 UDP-N-acetylglucosamine:LPS N-acetylglucosamine transferase [Longilinea arvoryzae]